MNIVFVEYRLKERNLRDYAGWIGNIRKKYAFELVEGTNQPRLMVEIWRMPPGADDFIRQRRDPGHPDWGALLKMIEGGPEKLHIWEFQPWAAK